MISNDQSIAALDRLMKVFPDNKSLPAKPKFSTSLYETAEIALIKAEEIIGQAKESDYYKCSRERFLHSIVLTLSHIKAGGKILDVGNAPGYLAIALDHLGYEIIGINLNNEWESTYPSGDWLKRFNVQAVDIEVLPLPYGNDQFDGIIFTEVLEHIAITHPKEILAEFKRILGVDGVLLFSTPNVCNISNIFALLKGLNVFWEPSIFYGSIDRHNREYTPDEVCSLFESTGFTEAEFYGINDHANWRAGTGDLIYELLAYTKHEHSLIRNTMIGAFKSINNK